MPKRTFQPNRRHPLQGPRLSYPHEDQSRPGRPQPSPRQGPPQDRRLRRLPRLVTERLRPLPHHVC